MLCEEKRRKGEGNGQKEGSYGIKTILAQAPGTVVRSTDNIFICLSLALALSTGE
jgi:hypothetical protein